MKPHEPPTNGAPVSRGPGDHPLWWLAFLALIAGQAWMTLGLFGTAHAVGPLLDERPVLSGRHPLHLYHGLLGARSFLNRGALSCFDPAFQAGYPKTPVFDDGSRPAELLLTAAGGRYLPSVYKLGVAGLCLLAPCVFAGTARAAGLSRFRACLACGLGMLVWWGKPCRDLLEAGDVDLLTATLAVLAQAGLLLRYHRAGAVERDRRGTDGLPRLVRSPAPDDPVGAAVPLLLLHRRRPPPAALARLPGRRPRGRRRRQSVLAARRRSTTGGFARRL